MLFVRCRRDRCHNVDTAPRVSSPVVSSLLQRTSLRTRCFEVLAIADGCLCLKDEPLTTSERMGSHACFNRLKPPFYTSESKMKHELYATLDSELHGFTTD